MLAWRQREGGLVKLPPGFGCMPSFTLPYVLLLPVSLHAAFRHVPGVNGREGTFGVS